MSREILQQALHHLVELADDLRRIPSDIAQTIAALEQELAKPEQEELIQFKDGKWSYVKKPWVGLTEDEVDLILWQGVFDAKDVRAIEARLKERNSG